MSQTCIEGIHYQTGKNIEILICDGKINKITQKQETIGNGLNEKKIIAPGLVDLQINGYRGLDYNTLPLVDGLVREITQAVFSKGVTTYYPTVITNSVEAITDAVRCIRIECQRDKLIGETI